jgi:recombination protein RecA
VTSLCIARNAQKQGRPVYYLNIEGRLKTRDLMGIRGLKVKEVKIIRSYRDEKKGVTRILTAEEFLTWGEWIVHNVPNAVIIFDSISQLAAEKELDGEMGEQHRAPGARLMSQFCRRVSNVVPVNNTIIISVLHLIANTSGFGAPKVESGGRKIKYACDVGLIAKTFKFKRGSGKGDDNMNKPPYGQEVLWQTTSTGIVAPGQQITSYIRYGVGIDEVLETMMLAKDAGFITKSGAWYTYEDHQEQGEEKFCNYLNDNPKVLKKLQKQVKDMLFG